MKKKLLQGIAFGVTSTILISSFAPVEFAFAKENEIMLVSESERILYLTEDMINKKGIISIKGEQYDSIIVNKELSVKKIILTGVNTKKIISGKWNKLHSRNKR